MVKLSILSLSILLVGCASLAHLASGASAAKSDKTSTLLNLLSSASDLDELDLNRLLGLDMLFKRMRRARGIINFRPFIIDPRHPWRSILFGGNGGVMPTIKLGRGGLNIPVITPALQNFQKVTKGLRDIVGSSSDSSEEESAGIISELASAATGSGSSLLNRAKMLAALMPFIPLPVPIPVTAKVAEEVINFVTGSSGAAGQGVASAAAEAATNTLTAGARQALIAAASALPSVSNAPHLYMNPAASLLLNSPLIPVNPLAAKLEARMLQAAGSSAADEDLTASGSSADVGSSANSATAQATASQVSPQEMGYDYFYHQPQEADQYHQDSQQHHQQLMDQQQQQQEQQQAEFDREQYARLAAELSLTAAGTAGNNASPAAAGQGQGPLVPGSMAALDELIKLAALEEAVSRVAALTEAEHGSADGITTGTETETTEKKR